MAGFLLFMLIAIFLVGCFGPFLGFVAIGILITLCVVAAQT